jgi:hypothetical protein
MAYLSQMRGRLRSARSRVRSRVSRYRSNLSNYGVRVITKYKTKIQKVRGRTRTKHTSTPAYVFALVCIPAIAAGVYFKKEIMDLVHKIFPAPAPAGTIPQKHGMGLNLDGAK